jgi:hypothetical protein
MTSISVQFLDFLRKDTKDWELVPGVEVVNSSNFPAYRVLAIIFAVHSAGLAFA